MTWTTLDTLIFLKHNYNTTAKKNSADGLVIKVTNVMQAMSFFLRILMRKKKVHQKKILSLMKVTPLHPLLKSLMTMMKELELICDMER